MEKRNFQIKTKKFKNNFLLKRKQFIIDVSHPEDANISKKELQKKLANIYKIPDPSTIFLFGFKTHFGGLKSTGLGFIYENLKAARQIEPRYRLMRNGLIEITKGSSKQRKERKNRSKKIRGIEKTKIKTGK
ncbi:rps24 (nucleomorph) [Hemiselmis andersenii]|uniref:Rps24 n=1 Tax=Hemiselmis andersenii TaxID=464988 RepID=A9BKB2_HEMAN|nr:rps24 [Hemiselmis andersenii]ABW97945.1 rps24 [Hemiselmis andersenii]|mmetsp:Transcript_28394/g.66373  ORF Transcript_28394/g.66373 Transcript_28394/m.66373 type:complete len:132 (+) Transcript_28394:43-438(+)